MKKFMKTKTMLCIVGIIAMVAIIGTMTACGGGGGKSAYYGTWKNKEGTITISANSIAIKTDVDFLMEDLTWLPIDNTNTVEVNYPTGFEIRGTVKKEARGLSPYFKWNEGKLFLFVHKNGGTIGFSNENDSYFSASISNTGGWRTFEK